MSSRCPVRSMQTYFTYALIRLPFSPSSIYKTITYYFTCISMFTLKANILIWLAFHRWVTHFMWSFVELYVYLAYLHFDFYAVRIVLSCYYYTRYRSARGRTLDTFRHFVSFTLVIWKKFWLKAKRIILLPFRRRKIENWKKPKNCVSHIKSLRQSDSVSFSNLWFDYSKMLRDSSARSTDARVESDKKRLKKNWLRDRKSGRAKEVRAKGRDWVRKKVYLTKKEKNQINSETDTKREQEKRKRRWTIAAAISA